MSRQSNLVHLAYVEVVKITDKAVGFRQSEGEDVVWAPLSVCANADDLREGRGSGTLSVQRWWALKNDLEDEE